MTCCPTCGAEAQASTYMRGRAVHICEAGHQFDIIARPTFLEEAVKASRSAEESRSED